MSRWFRVYEDLVDDPKVQQLPATTFKGLVNLWCLASQGGGTLPPIADIAFKLRLSPEKAQRLVNDLCEAGLLDAEDDTFQPHNWNGRQFKSDNVSERVKKHREKRRGNVPETLHGTPPETETEADTDSEKGKKIGADAPTEIVFQGSYLKRITHRDLSNWLKAYTALDWQDALAELSICDEYHAGSENPPPKPFFVASAWLKREHDRRTAKRRDEKAAEDRIYRGVDY
jgi:hypothetical protein